MLLLTKDNFSTEEVAELVAPESGKNLSAQSNIVQQTSSNLKTFYFTSSDKEIYTTMNVASEGDYYIYLISISDTGTLSVKHIY